MNPLDWTLLAVLLLFTFGGMRRGFVWQVFAIIGVIGAFFLAAKFHGDLANAGILESIAQRSAKAALVTSFLSIFILSTLIFSVIATKIAKKLQDKGLKRFDKSAGALLGAAKGVILLGGAALGIQEMGLPQGAVLTDNMREKGEGWIANSTLLPYLSEGCVILIDTIPAETRDAVVKKVQDNKDILRFNDAGNKLADDPNAEKSTAIKPNPLLDGNTLVDSGSQKATPSPNGEKAKPEAPVNDALAPLLNEGLDLGALRRLHFEEDEGSDLAPTSGSTDK